MRQHSIQLVRSSSALTPDDKARLLDQPEAVLEALAPILEAEVMDAGALARATFRVRIWATVLRMLSDDEPPEPDARLQSLLVQRGFTREEQHALLRDFSGTFRSSVPAAIRLLDRYPADADGEVLKTRILDLVGR